MFKKPGISPRPLKRRFDYIIEETEMRKAMESCDFYAVLDNNYEICTSLEKKVKSLYPDISVPFHKCCDFDSLDLFLADREDRTGIIFVDIHLGDENGIDYVRKLQKKETLWKFVYITGYPKMISGIFRTTPSGVLCKPIDTNDLKDTLSHLFEEIAEESSQILTVSVIRNGVRKIYARNILYIESNLRVLNIHTETETLSTYGKLSEIISELPAYFVFCHKSYIINTRKITNYQTDYVELPGNKKIPVSRPHIKKVRTLFFDGLKH